MRAERSEAPFTCSFISREKKRHKGWEPLQEMLYCKVIIFSFVCVGEGEALKRLIWETVNRIYANLMIPAITSGSTSHFQAAEILQFLLQSHSVWSSAHSLPPAARDSLAGQRSRTPWCDWDFCLRQCWWACWWPHASIFWGRMQRNPPWQPAVCKQPCNNKPFPPCLILLWSFANTNLSAQLLPN